MRRLKFFGASSLLAAALLLGAPQGAQASLLEIDLTDAGLAAAASGLPTYTWNSAAGTTRLEAGGTSGSALSFSSGGVGVGCASGHSCMYNMLDAQVDRGEWLNIHFDDGPVWIDSVMVSNMWKGWEWGVVDGDGFQRGFDGGWFGWTQVDVGRDTTWLSFSTKHFYDDFSIKKIKFKIKNKAPIPEPGSVALFVAGAGIVGFAVRRQLRPRV